MGDPKRLRKKYETPSHPWQKARIEEEGKIASEFGLKNKTEIWKARAQLRKYRHLARDMVGLSSEERHEKEEALVMKLEKMGLIAKGGTLDSVLSLKVEDLLNRRLQTRVWKMGMARTSEQSRQLIAHGHIAIKGRKITSPGMIVGIDQEKLIEWYGEPVKIEVTPITPATSFKETAEKSRPTAAEKIGAKDAVDNEMNKEAADAIEGDGQ